MTLSSFLRKAANVIGLVPVCHCKGGRIMSFGKAFGLVTCPLLFSTLPRSLGSPANYSSPLDLVFCSSTDYECDTASIYMSLQGWQADVLRQAFGFSSARCASSAAVNVTRPASIYVDRIR